MKNIHILPTDKPSRLIKDFNNKLILNYNNVKNLRDGYQFQNIYITNDEEIKEGDWVLYTRGNRIHCQKLEDKNDVELANIEDSGAFKIILTTDSDLIEDGIQAIDNEFLEWFVQNPSCEEVVIEPIPNNSWGFDLGEPMTLGYKIIIPKEEPKQKQKQHLIEIMRGDEELGLYEEPKQETTLEEFAEKETEIQGWGEYEGLSEQYAIKQAFINGAKWQAERMYSEEDMKSAIEKTIEQCNKTMQESYGLLEIDVDYIFEQFKKK